MPLAPRGDHSTDPFAAQDPGDWIPTNGTENLPPDGQTVAVLYNYAPGYIFERIGHVERAAPGIYWQLRGDPTWYVVDPERVLYWYPLPRKPKGGQS